MSTARPRELLSRACSFCAGLALALTAAACTQVSLPDSVGSTTTSCVATPGQELLERTNAMRRDRGLVALLVDERLARAARAHSADLAARDAGGHTGGDGSLPDVRADRAGYPWTFIAENVAVGQTTAPQVVADWMASPEHRSNLLAREARHVGIGHAYRAGTRWKHYWTAVYGSAGTLSEPAGGCNP